MKFQREMLKRLRTERKLSRRALGEAAGMSGQGIWKIESGRSEDPHTRTVNALANVLGVDPASFYGVTANHSKKRTKQTA